MKILTRIKHMIQSVINGWLDKLETPEMAIDRCYKNFDANLAEVKVNTVQVVASHKKAVIARQNCEQKIEELEYLAKKAYEAGNEDDVRVFLKKKIDYEDDLDNLMVLENDSCENKNKMLAIHDSMVDDVNALKRQGDVVKGNLAIARSRKIVDDSLKRFDDASSDISKFNAAIEKADDIIIKQEIEESLETRSLDDEVETLTEKYVELDKNVRIDRELELLKEGTSPKNNEVATEG